jgi:5-hydroxyisourate hydrolase-like protein (transthyretin family)
MCGREICRPKWSKLPLLLGLPKMNEEQKEKLNTIATELDGKVEHYSCCDNYTSHKKIVITYDVKSKGQNN